MTPILRIARPTDRLAEVARFYTEGLGFSRLSSFENHDGFDGVILGHPSAPWHLEFTHHRGTAVGRAPTQDNLLAFYLPEPDDFEAAVTRLEAFGVSPVPSYNPWWDARGKTYEDPDGYRVVLENSEWSR
jgi:catechol 2,3-dioxygenase-like lactoylglutathione lyase family enzyme